MTRPAKILIVDDEPNVRLVFRTALESSACSVAEAGDGESGLLRINEWSPDLILLDLLMPGMTGMEVLKQLRDEDNDVPVVIVTAHGSIPDAVLAMKLGAIDFITKPLTPSALRHVVEEVLDRHAPADQETGLQTAKPPTTVVVAPPVINLTPVKLALNRRQFDRAEQLLEEALDLAPESVEAHTLLGVLQESRGQEHAAYRSYKLALERNSHYQPALDNMKRYCERFGLDFENHAINPAAAV